MMEWALSQPWHIASELGAATEEPEPWIGLADRQVVTLVLNGRPDAYGELVRRHQTAVYNIAYRLAGDRQEALDLAQETFVRAFSALDSFDLERPFGPWIGRIATNLTLNWLQRRRVHTVPLAPEVGSDQAEARRVPDYSAEPERVYLAGEQQAQLRQAILSLPPHYRAVIELRHFQDRSYEEIAEMLRLPLSDVKSHLFRARRLLEALALMGQPLFQWPTPDGFPDSSAAWAGNLLARWRFALGLATGSIKGTSLDLGALVQASGARTVEAALDRFSILLLGAPLPPPSVDALVGQLGGDLDAEAVVAVLLASPQYQWR